MFTGNSRLGVNRSAWILFVCVLITATWLRFFNIGRESLMIDESTYAWWLVNLPVYKMLDALRQVGSNPPFYFLILKVYSQIIGDSEFALRSLSAGIDCLAVGIAFWLGWKVGRLPGAFACSLFWAVHPALVWNARVARPYALGSAISLLLLCVFLLLLEKGSPTKWALASLLIAIGLLNQFFFFLTAAALLLWSILRFRRDPTFFRSYSLVFIIALIPLSIWIYWFFQIDTPLIGTGWIRVPSLTDIGLTIWNLLSGYAGVSSLPSIVFGSMVLVLLGIAGTARNKSPVASYSIFCGVLVPILAVWLISQRRPLYIDRYFFPLYPFLALAMGYAGAELWRILQEQHLFTRSAVLGVFLTLICSIGIWNAWQVHIDAKYELEDWRGLVSYLGSKGLGDESIWLTEPEAEIAISYYHPVSKDALIYSAKPTCPSTCWWVLRQPYTMVHAYAQAVTDPNRKWKPAVPDGCQLLDRWDSRSGIALWKVHCDG